MAMRHGTTNFTVVGELIEVTFIGDFNKEGVNCYELELRKIIESLQGKPFLLLIDSVDFTGGTPEAYQALDQFNDWLNTQKMTAKAVIMKNMVNQQIYLDRTSSLQQQNLCLFQDYTEARNWLLSHR